MMAKRTERLNSNLKGGTNERHGQTNGKTKFESYLHWDMKYKKKMKEFFRTLIIKRLMLYEMNV